MNTTSGVLSFIYENMMLELHGNFFSIQPTTIGIHKKGKI